jgi:uncharacterized protein YprB with RNaseH-like and TPR domain
LGTNIDDKLKRLKKERELRSRVSRTRPGAVEDTWEKINRVEELSVKEKLQKLIDLTGPKKEKKPAITAAAPVPREPLLFYENPYPLQTKYGKNPLADGLKIKGDVLYYLGRDNAFEALDLSTALFVDLETTGLAGGTGTVPFLVGLGYYRDNRFNVAQYFLGELAEEERMIDDLGRFFSEMNFQSVVTYNGKAFDMPLLETRFILYRRPFPLSDLPHLDLLFSARSLWKHKHESCRLSHLAQQIVEAERAEDIPSAEIPVRYFEFLRTGNFSLMEPVLYHNQEDILSLLGLVIAAAKLFFEGREPRAGDEFDAMDLIGVGKVFESAGHVEKSMELFQRALEGDLPLELALNVKRKLSYHFKKNQDWERAISLWQDLSREDQLFCYRELAMYFEHRVGKLEDAKRAAEEGLTLSMNVSPSLQKDFEHRLERLNDKIRKRQGKNKSNRP